MNEESAKLLDATGWQLLAALQENARLSFRELGKLVGLAPSTAAERVRRLEEAGILLGYHAEVNLTKVGLPITAFVRMSALGQKGAQRDALLNALPEVLECYRLAGSECFLMKVCVSSVKHLEELIDHLS